MSSSHLQFQSPDHPGGRYDVRQPLLRPFHTAVQAFRAGTDSPRHYLERCLAQIGQAEPAVQAFVCLNVEEARMYADDASIRYRDGRPLSPIDGMPYGAKDIIETRSLPTQMNSPIFAGFQSRRDAACIIALKAAGAVLLGKTVTTEFACGRSGPTRNPYDATRTPGGSSSGSAASVGAGMVPATLGTQTQASVIRPAGYCGSYALKPSHNLLSVDGIAPLAPSMDTLGIYGGSLEDVWNVTAAISSTSPGIGGPRLAAAELPGAAKPRSLVRLDTVGWKEVDAESCSEFERVLRELSSAGVEIVDRRNSAEVEALEQHLTDVPDVSLKIFAYESQWPLRAYAECGKTLVGERVYDLLALAASMSEADYRAMIASRDGLRSKVTALAARHDAFVALACSGPAIADIAYTGSRSYPVPWSLVGGPSVALPVMASAGLPLGLQVMGSYASDTKTMATSRYVRDVLMA